MSDFNSVPPSAKNASLFALILRPINYQNKRNVRKTETKCYLHRAARNWLWARWGEINGPRTQWFFSRPLPLLFRRLGGPILNVIQRIFVMWREIEDPRWIMERAGLKFAVPTFQKNIIETTQPASLKYGYVFVDNVLLFVCRCSIARCKKCVHKLKIIIA